MAISNFHLSSDYPSEKIVFKFEFNTGAIAGDGYKAGTFKHGLGFMPLFRGVWSTTADFTEKHPLSSGIVSSSSKTGYEIDLSVQVEGENVIYNINNNSSSAKTVYFRFYGFLPVDTNLSTIPPSTAIDWKINSDFESPKIVKEGWTAWVKSSSAVSEEIWHGLGFTPFVECWSETEYASGGGYITDFDLTRIVKVDSERVIIERKSSESQNINNDQKRYYYRILGDKAE